MFGADRDGDQAFAIWGTRLIAKANAPDVQNFGERAQPAETEETLASVLRFVFPRI